MPKPILITNLSLVVWKYSENFRVFEELRRGANDMKPPSGYGAVIWISGDVCHH